MGSESPAATGVQCSGTPGTLEAMTQPMFCHRSSSSVEAAKQQAASQGAVDVAWEQDASMPTRLMCVAGTQRTWGAPSWGSRPHGAGRRCIIVVVEQANERYLLKEGLQ